MTSFTPNVGQTVHFKPLRIVSVRETDGSRHDHNGWWIGLEGLNARWPLSRDGVFLTSSVQIDHIETPVPVTLSDAISLGTAKPGMKFRHKEHGDDFTFVLFEGDKPSIIGRDFRVILIEPTCLLARLLELVEDV